MTKRLFLKAAIAGLGLVSGFGRSSAQPAPVADFVAPGEFEPQEYIWLSWIEKGSLGSAPMKIRDIVM